MIFGTEAARASIASAVAQIEEKTAAEVVVVARARSGHYRDAHYLFGFCATMVSLAVLLYMPQEIPYWLFLVDAAAAFVIFAMLAALLEPLGRAITTLVRRERQVLAAAHACFYEKSVARTTGRWGVLVYVSAFERTAVVVPDIGVDVEAIGSAWKDALSAIEAAAESASPEELGLALRALGAALATQLPRTSNDRNELPDEVDEGA